MHWINLPQDIIKCRTVVNTECLLTSRRTVCLWRRTLLQVGSEFVDLSEINLNYQFFFTTNHFWGKRLVSILILLYSRAYSGLISRRTRIKFDSQVLLRISVRNVFEMWMWFLRDETCGRTLTHGIYVGLNFATSCLVTPRIAGVSFRSPA